MIAAGEKPPSLIAKENRESDKGKEKEVVKCESCRKSILSQEAADVVPPAGPLRDRSLKRKLPGNTIKLFSTPSPPPHNHAEVIIYKPRSRLRSRPTPQPTASFPSSPAQSFNVVDLPDMPISSSSQAPSSLSSTYSSLSSIISKSSLI